MDSNTIEILKLVPGFLTPTVTFILGFWLIKKIETIKSSVSKEKSWQEYWASQFIETSKKYNDIADNVLHGFHNICQTTHEKLPGWENDFKELEKELAKNIRALIGLEWKIQTATQFAPETGQNVQDKQKEFYRLIGELLKTKQGDWDAIRVAQFKFNEAVRYAHSEILQISPNPTLQRTRFARR